jgi:ferric-dicitrate binding protein FerR (iron transport regulator)
MQVDKPNYKWGQLTSIVNQWKQNKLDSIKVTAKLSQRDNQWCVRIDEEDDEGKHPNAYSSMYRFSSTHGDAVEWTQTVLSSWKSVNRMSHDMWYFKTKKEAEKFLTLFTLKWVR